MRAKFFIAGIIINLLAGGQSLGQTFTVGSSGMTIKAGTPMFMDSLVMTPSANLTITSNSLTHSASATTVNGVSSILNQFTFATLVTYSGTASLGYTTGELNGNTASQLVVAYNNIPGGTYTLNCASTADTTNRKVTTSALSAASLYNISAVQSSVSVSSITGASALNAGTSTTLGDATTGGTWSSYNTSLATVSSSGLVYGLSGGTDTIAYIVSNTCNTATAIKLLNVNSNSIWIGVTSTNWGDSSNWSTGIVPTAMVNATIPAGTLYSPQVISGSYSAKDVSLASGGIVTLNSATNLHVKGNLSNYGIFQGAGTLNLDTSITQTISGTGNVRNIKLNNAAGATISAGNKMSVDSLLTLTSGTLTTSDSLVLNSDSSVTARIAALPSSGASISGNVKTMQYIEGGYRRFRFWSHPFSSYIPLSQIENYIDVTGSGGSSNGFTTTATNSPSAFRYDPTVGNSSLSYDIGWRPFASAYTTTDSNRFKQYQGIRLFFRGAKGEGLGYIPYTPSATTVGMWGNVNQGNQTIYLSKGTSANQDYNMVGNPYPSPVDIGTILYNAKTSGNITGSGFYIWNPSLGAAGQFQLIFFGTTSASPYYLPSYCSFQVRAANNGDSLNFTESNKGATASANLFRSEPGYISLAVYDMNYHPWDMLYIKFNEAATDNEDKMYDATKPAGADFNFYSLSADNQNLIADARPYRANATIPLGISSSYAQQFIIKAEQMALPEGGTVYLHDKLLKQYILLSQGTEYTFTITNDKETQGNNRFELSMAPAGITTTQNSQGLSMTMYPNPAADDVTLSFSCGQKANVSVNITDVSGMSVYNSNLGMQQSGSKKIGLKNFTPGIYMVEFTSGNEKVVQRLVKE